MRELTGKTKIRLSQIKGLKEWRERLALDKHGKPVPVGEVRRWADGKLHEKTHKGWTVVAHSKEYDLKEQTPPKSSKDIRKISTQEEFDDLVEHIFSRDYKDAPNVVRLPKINKGLSTSLGLSNNTQFIFKAKYPHINPVRKTSEDQALRKEEYKKIPDIMRNTKSAYIDKDKGNFFIPFEDPKDPSVINKLVFNKTKKGNYLVTVSKVNKKDELASRKILLVSGRG